MEEIDKMKKEIFVVALLICVSVLPLVDSMEVVKEHTTMQMNEDPYFVNLSFNVQKYENEILVPAPNCEIWLYLYFSSLWQLPTLIGLTNSSGMYPPSENYSGYRIYEGNDIKIKIVHGWYGSWESEPMTITNETPSELHFDVILDKNKSKPIDVNSCKTNYETEILGRTHIRAVGTFENCEKNNVVYGHIFVGMIGFKLVINKDVEFCMKSIKWIVMTEHSLNCVIKN